MERSIVKPSKEEIFADIVKIIEDISQDWEYAGDIKPETSILLDLDFESIDVVALGTTLEEVYGQPFPFAQYLSNLEQTGTTDLQLKELVDFVHANLKKSEDRDGKP